MITIRRVPLPSGRARACLGGGMHSPHADAASRPGRNVHQSFRSDEAIGCGGIDRPLQDPPPELRDRQLLTLATQHDPILLDNFKGYTVRVLRQSRHSVVLVCDATGTRTLLEDAGCSGPMDRHQWMGKPEPCEFTIDTAALCGKD